MRIECELKMRVERDLKTSFPLKRNWHKYVRT